MNSSKQIASTDEKNEFTDSILHRKQQLAFNTPVLELSADFGRTSIVPVRADQIAFSISPDGTNAIKQLSAKLNSTLFCTLLAVYNILLFRHTKQGDILIGLPRVKDIPGKTDEFSAAIHYTPIHLAGLSMDWHFDELLECIHREVSAGNAAKEFLHGEFFHNDLLSAQGVSFPVSYNLIFSFRSAETGTMEFSEWVSKVCVPEKYRDAFGLSLCIEETAEGSRIA